MNAFVLSRQRLLREQARELDALAPTSALGREWLQSRRVALSEEGERLARLVRAMPERRALATAQTTREVAACATV